MGVKTLMIAGGGTGGHIYPAIAIAREYLSRDPERTVVFVGTARGLEKTIVPKAGFPLELIDVAGLKGMRGLNLVRNILRLPLGFIQAWKHVGHHRPNVVLGVGGYSSGPVLVAAKLRGVPTIIHDANAFPGLANRVLARWVTTVAAAFAEALPRMKRTDGVVTGNPIRKEFFDLGATVRQPTTDNRQRLLIFGGSQGSRILNDTMTAALPHLAPLQGKLEIVHQTGPNELAKVQGAYQQSPFANARVVPYLDPMADEIAAADLVVSRAGAMTIGELAAIGRAAILIPFAQATNNHQELNARVVEKAGGAVVITEAELSSEKLAKAISEVLSDPQRAQRMGTSSKTLATPDATKSIVDLIEKIQRD
ncbi:MAG TPA: undecaprenyldiphospho-muramoylpentapeptide beta-N-acetylglucosaminyltransferase [Thermoanaerobaculia bacterium]|jgi:UDP-N-acetylglucosamine--N-acetylmuramyl-(pentapeptide) pyrophosphoryl-undecaprenol N-acetylglucosamine transferase|nr:undecaprenyldiphospho-muramoylpentapeptide beta-N-acetylglucosaminyltransferase [Thermoanaerobaculia bacterium]